MPLEAPSRKDRVCLGFQLDIDAPVYLVIWVEVTSDCLLYMLQHPMMSDEDWTTCCTLILKALYFVNKYALANASELAAYSPGYQELLEKTMDTMFSYKYNRPAKLDPMLFFDIYQLASEFTSHFLHYRYTYDELYPVLREGYCPFDREKEGVLASLECGHSQCSVVARGQFKMEELMRRFAEFRRDRLLFSSYFDVELY